MSQQQSPQQQATDNSFESLLNINVNDYVSVKGDGSKSFSYISWVSALELLWKRDPEATYQFREWDGKPYYMVGATGMVHCTVNAFGRSRSIHLPIIDHRNRPIADFTSGELNTALMRCLAKAIALHGIGLYIYRGEDLPPGATSMVEDFVRDIMESRDLNELNRVGEGMAKFVEEFPEARERLEAAYKSRQEALRNPPSAARGVSGMKDRIAKRRGVDNNQPPKDE